MIPAGFRDLSSPVKDAVVFASFGPRKRQTKRRAISLSRRTKKVQALVRRLSR